MSCLEKVLVINGAGNTSKLVFGIQATNQTVSLFDFTGVTRYTLTFTVAGVVTVLDTAITAGIITSIGDGELEFDLGAAGIPIGSYVADLRIFNATYPTGFLLHEGDGHSLMLDVL